MLWAIVMNLGRCILNQVGRYFRAVACVARATSLQEGRSFVVRRLSARVQSVSPFPLTPTLSPEEREKPRQSVGVTETVGTSKERALPLPLLWGEGWGEGERAVASRQAPDLLACRIRSSWLFELIPLLVLSLCWAASAQISTAPATNAAVKIAAPGFVGSRSCRECHEKFYQLWSTSFHGLAMQPYTSELARTNLTEQKTEVVAGKYRFRADPRKSVVIERTAASEKSYPPPGPEPDTNCDPCHGPSGGHVSLFRELPPNHPAPADIKLIVLTKLT